MSGRVVVGYAPTPAGYQALRYAIGQARERAASLIVVRAVGREFDPVPAEAWVETRVAITAEVAGTFRDVVGGVPVDVDVRVVVESGSLDRVLAAAVKQADDVIVLGACTRRRRLSAGHHRAVIARCLRGSTCPVVIVPAPELARHGSVTRLERGMVAEVEQFLRDPQSIASKGVTP